MAHVHEKVDFVADVFIVNEDAVLLRKHENYGIWLPPGGHVELDEDPAEAAVREIKEEVGLDIELVGAVRSFADGTRDLVLPQFMNRHRVSDTHEHVALMYLARSATRDVVESADEKSQGIHWFTKEELADSQYGIRESTRHYAERALDVLRQK